METVPICKDCKYLRKLCIWNLGGKNLPNYKSMSNCCILFEDEGMVHQVNNIYQVGCEEFEENEL